MAKIHIGPHSVSKRFCDNAIAQTAVERARALLDAGEVSTPKAKIAPDDQLVVVFERIHGSQLNPTATEASRGDIQRDLQVMLECLAMLHRSVPLEGTPRLDPLIKIGPRLTERDRQQFAHILNLAALITEYSASSTVAQLHGDAHPGQFIRDFSGRTWLLDLDDIAIGPPEADLANLAANLASQKILPRLTVLAQYRQWRSAIMDGYHVHSASRLNPDLFDHFGRLAALRRLLKLRLRQSTPIVSQLEAWLSSDDGHRTS